MGLLEAFKGCTTIEDYTVTIDIALNGSGVLDEYQDQPARLSPSLVFLASKLHGLLDENNDPSSCTNLSGFITGYLANGDSPATRAHLRRKRPKSFGEKLELETQVLDARCHTCDRVAETLSSLLERGHTLRHAAPKPEPVQFAMPVEDHSIQEAAEAEKRQLRSRVRAEPYSPPNHTRITAYIRATDLAGGPMVAKFLEAATSFRDWQSQSDLDVKSPQEAKQYRTPGGEVKGTRIEFGTVRATGTLAPLNELYFVPPELHDCAEYVFQLQLAERWFGTRMLSLVCARCGNTLLPYATPAPGTQGITALFGVSSRFSANDEHTSPQGHEVVQPGCCTVNVLLKNLDLLPLERPEVIVRQHIVVRVRDPIGLGAYLLAVENKILWGGSTDFKLRTYKGPYKRAIESAREMTKVGREGIIQGPFYCSSRKPRT